MDGGMRFCSGVLLGYGTCGRVGMKLSLKGRERPNINPYKTFFQVQEFRKEIDHGDHITVPSHVAGNILLQSSFAYSIFVDAARNECTGDSGIGWVLITQSDREIKAGAYFMRLSSSVKVAECHAILHALSKRLQYGWIKINQEIKLW
ncbi:hypothetical protein Sjap_023958 [Stephania japonica]|uniref:RNase H type-1 domain-containing protein n=1 Tax=Stephania japonica TaxID=461633 RepID=A0AAP0HNH6_9MAGN